jgi:two-component system sensor histidine kinase CreC
LVEVTAARDATVQGDRFLLGQALANLLDNAIAFSPEAGRIELALHHTGAAQCELTIADQGAGIPEFAQERLFERFYSLPRPATGEKSTGLGLAFVREVAQLHGGAVELNNRPQGGALARLTLPLAR